jgi:ABC-type nitrate/sulfonate/bicarbonate transport system substrate-binding protein
MTKRKIVLALDWTPNTNHTGFYVAKSKGLYEDKGLVVEFISPHTDGYHRTPASRLRDGSATFAVGPSESVISAHCGTGSDKPRLQVRSLHCPFPTLLIMMLFTK